MNLIFNERYYTLLSYGTKKIMYEVEKYESFDFENDRASPRWWDKLRFHSRKHGEDSKTFIL